MNDSGSRILNGEASAGGSPRAPGRRPGNGTRPRAFLDDTRGGMACGICRFNAPARAPGGMLALRTPRSLCGRGPCEKRGTGTTPLPNRQL